MYKIKVKSPAPDKLKEVQGLLLVKVYARTVARATVENWDREGEKLNLRFKHHSER